MSKPSRILNLEVCIVLFELLLTVATEYSLIIVLSVLTLAEGETACRPHTQGCKIECAHFQISNQFVEQCSKLFLAHIRESAESPSTFREEVEK
jgi:hypothetical protein